MMTGVGFDCWYGYRCCCSGRGNLLESCSSEPVPVVNLSAAHDTVTVSLDREKRDKRGEKSTRKSFRDKSKQ